MPRPKEGGDPAWVSATATRWMALLTAVAVVVSFVTTLFSMRSYQTARDAAHATQRDAWVSTSTDAMREMLGSATQVQVSAETLLTVFRFEETHGHEPAAITSEEASHAFDVAFGGFLVASNRAAVVSVVELNEEAGKVADYMMLLDRCTAILYNNVAQRTDATMKMIEHEWSVGLGTRLQHLSWQTTHDLVMSGRPADPAVEAEPARATEIPFSVTGDSLTGQCQPT